MLDHPGIYCSRDDGGGCETLRHSKLQSNYMGCFYTVTVQRQSASWSSLSSVPISKHSRLHKLTPLWSIPCMRPCCVETKLWRSIVRSHVWLGRPARHRQSTGVRLMAAQRMREWLSGPVTDRHWQNIWTHETMATINSQWVSRV